MQFERVNSKFKPENYTVRNRIQYENRTIQKQYKIPNMMDHMRDNRKFKPGQSCTNRDRVNRTTKSISGYITVNQNERERKSYLSIRTTEGDIYREDKEGERRRIQDMGERQFN